jgi:hypothetical protein
MKTLKQLFKKGYTLQRICHGRYRIKVSRFFELFPRGYLDLNHPTEVVKRNNEHYSTRCVGSHEECLDAFDELGGKYEQDPPF